MERFNTFLDLMFRAMGWFLIFAFLLGGKVWMFPRPLDVSQMQKTFEEK
jgi:hypothetical protein